MCRVAGLYFRSRRHKPAGRQDSPAGRTCRYKHVRTGRLPEKFPWAAFPAPQIIGNGAIQAAIRRERQRFGKLRHFALFSGVQPGGTGNKGEMKRLPQKSRGLFPGKSREGGWKKLRLSGNGRICTAAAAACKNGAFPKFSVKMTAVEPRFHFRQRNDFTILN